MSYGSDLILGAILPLQKDPVERDYSERFKVWLLKQDLYPSDWDEGEEVCIFDGPGLEEGRIQHLGGEEFPRWLRDLGKDFGKETVSGYILEGISYTYLDYYYILSKNGRRVFQSCVGRIKIKED